VGMVVYEQDWMYNEMQGLNSTLQNATLGGAWLEMMGAGADHALPDPVGIQYCMTFPRMLMHTVKVPAVTQFRASDDYHPGQTGPWPETTAKGGQGCHFPFCVYYVGTTSLLGWALGVAPSKDNYWSVANESGDPYRGATEPYSEMQSAISALSTGPVATSDKPGSADVDLIMRTCTAEGRLLQPSRPASAIDACFAGDAFGAADQDGTAKYPVGIKPKVYPVMSTHTGLAGLKWGHVLSIGLKAAYSLSPEDIPMDLTPAAPYLVWASIVRSGKKPTPAAFSVSQPLVLPAAAYKDFGLWHTSPVFPTAKVALLGETSKWVPVSVNRFTSIRTADTHPGEVPAGEVLVSLAGSDGEATSIDFADMSGSLTEVKCVFGSSGKLLISWKMKKCS